MKLKPTVEQQNIINLALEGKDLRINAFAGASKTTTLSMIAKAKDKAGCRKGMYLAFNKVNATEAQGRFPASVDCRTVHSLAYRSTPKNLIAKLKYQKLFPKDVSRILGFNGTFVQAPDGERKYLSIGLKTSMVNRTLSRFCNSGDDKLSIKHLVLMDWMYEPVGKKYNFDEIGSEIVSLASKFWDMIIDEDSSVPMTHDAYLKLFSMNCKQLAVDYIMVDENQDSSPVILKILEKQHRAQKIFVGDRYQAIYGWRGAINAMDVVSGEDVFLSKSFRFGNNVEYLANIILNYSGNKIPLKGNGDSSGKILYRSPSLLPNAIICRKNATVIEKIFEYSELYPELELGASCDVGDIERFAGAYNALQKSGKTDHPLLFAFGSINELQTYCKENPEDRDVAGMVALINKFGSDTIMDILKRCTETQCPDMLITTAHKAKGLEWDTVVIAEDFNYKVDDETEVVYISQEELNLIYVAITRAKKDIDVGGIYDLLEGISKINDRHYELESQIMFAVEVVAEVVTQESFKDVEVGLRPKIFDEDDGELGLTDFS